MLGVDNLLKLAACCGDLGTLGYAIMEDGKISFRDLRHLGDAVHIVKGFLGVDVKAMMPEIKDLTDEETALLAACFNEHLKIGGGTSEQAIEEGISVIIQILEVAAKFMDWGKAPKFV